jgi:hypothetical protein
MTPCPTDIDAITRMQDGALRNLLITQRYHELSAALLETLGSGNVNWSTFATWASKTAGMSIRNEEVPPFVADIVSDSHDDVMHPLGKIESAIDGIVSTTGFHSSFLLGPIQDTIGEVSSSIAKGNLAVFQELAPQFVRFVDLFRGKPADDATLAAMLAPLDPRPTSAGGQELLRNGFEAYVQAMRVDDAVTRARWVFFGNCLIGLHEQTRLQPQIQEAMDAPIEQIDGILKKHLDASLVAAASKPGILAQLRDAVAKPLEDLHDVVQDLWEQIATRLLMSLALPGGQTLPLGRNIPTTAAAQPFLPAPLQNITAPQPLLDLLGMYDRARGSSDVGSASVDWRVLDDRMNFIVNLFRSRQQDDELLGPPFTDAQRAAFEAGRMPSPDLGKL